MAFPPVAYPRLLVVLLQKSNIDYLSRELQSAEKIHGKMDCLIYEIIFINKYNPCLNVQSDSIKAKVLT